MVGDEQGLLEARIRTLRARLDGAEIVADAAGGEVGIGSVVEIEDEKGETMRVEVSSVSGSGAVSPTSPLGLSSGAAWLGTPLASTEIQQLGHRPTILPFCRASSSCCSSPWRRHSAALSMTRSIGQFDQEPVPNESSPPSFGLGGQSVPIQENNLLRQISLCL